MPRYGDRHGVWGPAVQIEGQAQCPIHQSGTFNAQRSTPNFQLGDRKGAWCAGYGDRHSVWGPTVQIEGQARCPIRRSEMLNDQRSSLNLQRDDRKGRVVGGIWGQTRNLGDRTFDPVDLAKHRSDGSSWRGAQIWGQARCLGPDSPNRGTGTMSDTPIRNVQRTTLNSQLSTG